MRGDLDRYLEDIYESGGKVLSSEINYDAETANVIVEIADVEAFNKKFVETETCEFTGYRHSIQGV